MQPWLANILPSGVVLEGVRFGLATAASAVLALGLPILLHELFGLNEEISVGVSFLIVFLFNFISVRIYVFRSKENALYQLIKFAIFGAMFRGLEYAVFLIMFRVTGIHYTICLIAVLTVSFVAKFFFHRRVTFKRA